MRRKKSQEETTKMDDRTKYIGGSDVAAILGYSKWRTPLDVYREKAEGVTNDVKNSFVYWGSKYEPILRDAFSELTGKKVIEQEGTKYHEKYPFLAANVDGILPEDNAILEIKTVSGFARSLWGAPNCDLDREINGNIPSKSFKQEDGYIPEQYLFQVLQYAFIYNVDKVYFAVYFGNDMPLRYYEYKRDKALENIVVDLMIDFWENNILKRCPPDALNYKEASSILGRSTEEKFCVSDNEMFDKVVRVRKIAEKIKSLNDESDIIKKDIIEFMGSSEYLSDTTGEKLCSFKTSFTKRFDTKIFKLENKSLYDKYILQSESRRFCLT